MGALDFDTVYERHAPYARRVLQRFGVPSSDLDDALQDAFVTIHRLLSGFEGRAKIETWIHAICWRVAAGYRRKLRRAAANPAAEPAIEIVSELPPAEQLHACLGALDASDRDLLVLHEVGEMSLLSLSELTGKSRDVLRRRIEHARRTLGRTIAHGPTAGPRLVVDEQKLAELAHHADHREYLCADYGFTRCGHMVMARWRGPKSDLESMAISTKFTLDGALESGDGGFTYFSVIEPGAGPPDEDARLVTAWLMGEVADRLNAIAFVALSPGTRELVPQIANSCAFMSGSQINFRHFVDVEAALEWLAPQTPGASLPALLEHAEGFRQRLWALGPQTG